MPPKKKTTTPPIHQITSSHTGKKWDEHFWEREREECFFLTVYHKIETHMFLWLNINM